MTTPIPPTPQSRVESDLKAALKAGEKERLSTLRMLLTEIKNERIETGTELGEDAFGAVVKRAIKQRHDSAEQYEKGDRPELAAKECREAELLESYLPEQASDEEVRAAVEAFVAEAGLAGPGAIGPVMREMIGRFGAKADGATINRVARGVLAGKS